MTNSENNNSWELIIAIAILSVVFILLIFGK
jgi:hypothetical protein